MQNRDDRTLISTGVLDWGSLHWRRGTAAIYFGPQHVPGVDVWKELCLSRTLDLERQNIRYLDPSYQRSHHSASLMNGPLW